MSIKLHKHQINHYRKIKRIVKDSYFYIDGTKTGDGKMFISLKLAQDLGYPILVVCPKSMMSDWTKHAKANNVPIVNIITYNSLRATVGRQPTHGLLTRLDTKNNTIFEPTDKLRNIVNSGVLAIMDEFHHIKNASDQNKAATGLISAFVDGISRVALLSASPVDGEELSVNILRALNIIKSNVNPNAKNVRAVDCGRKDLLNYIKDDPNFKMWSMKAKIINNNSQFNSLVHNIFIKVIKPKVMSIADPRPCDHEITIRNAFYRPIDEAEQCAYDDAVLNLHNSIVNFRHRTVKIGSVTESLMNLQLVKAPLFVRLAKRLLSSNPNAKVLLYVDYNVVIDYIAQRLSNWKPLIYNGSTKLEDRTVYVERFQQPNGDYRLMICNPQSGGEGISLHDTDGNWPRFMFVMPGYKVTNLHQTGGRVWRVGVASDVHIDYVYMDSQYSEESILRSFSRKGQVLGEVVSEQDCVFPNEYQSVVLDSN